jgi:hypothetical protein
MRLVRVVLPALLALSFGGSLHAADAAPSPWDKLKSLAGTWQGTYEGKQARLTYALVSNGTALMETMDAPDSTQMVTLYHPDGASLLMTHYCAAGNQPRMRAKGMEAGQQLTFAYVDAANLKSADDQRMTRLVLTFTDANHLAQEWTSEGGGKKEVARFEFTRQR